MIATVREIRRRKKAVLAELAVLLRARPDADHDAVAALITEFTVRSGRPRPPLVEHPRISGMDVP